MLSHTEDVRRMLNSMVEAAGLPNGVRWPKHVQLTRRALTFRETRRWFGLFYALWRAFRKVNFTWRDEDERVWVRSVRVADGRPLVEDWHCLKRPGRIPIRWTVVIRDGYAVATPRLEFPQDDRRPLLPSFDDHGIPLPEEVNLGRLRKPVVPIVHPAALDGIDVSSETDTFDWRLWPSGGECYGTITEARIEIRMICSALKDAMCDERYANVSVPPVPDDIGGTLPMEEALKTVDDGCISYIPEELRAEFLRWMGCYHPKLDQAAPMEEVHRWREKLMKRLVAPIDFFDERIPPSAVRPLPLRRPLPVEHGTDDAEKRAKPIRRSRQLPTPEPTPAETGWVSGSNWGDSVAGRAQGPSRFAQMQDDDAKLVNGVLQYSYGINREESVESSPRTVVDDAAAFAMTLFDDDAAACAFGGVGGARTMVPCEADGTIPPADESRAK